MKGMMNKSQTFRRQLVLLGGGHAHIQVLKSMAMKPLHDVRICLVSDVSYAPYSGMLPELLAGGYRAEDCHFDLRRLAYLAGVEFIHTPAHSLDTKKAIIYLVDRPPLSYDALSINIGATPMLPPSGISGSLLPLKPIAALLDRWKAMMSELKRLHECGEKTPKIALVGGGAAGCEVAISLQEKVRSLWPDFRLDLWHSSETLLSGFPSRASTESQHILAEQGVRLFLGCSVLDVQENKLFADDGSVSKYDWIIWALGVEPPPFAEHSKLELDKKGFIKVDHFLRCLKHENIFCVGDVASFPEALPKAGVYAVRQGPILAHNLRAFLCNRSMKPYRPQKTILSLLRLGKANTLLRKGSLSFTSSYLWSLKDHIDRSFMKKWQDYDSVALEQGQFIADSFNPELKGHLDQKLELTRPLCGGCGSKLPPMNLYVSQNEDAQWEKITAGDVGILNLPNGEPLAQSIDVIKDLGVDLFTFGRLAALHSLNDIIVSGSKPLSALAVVQLKQAAPHLLNDDFTSIMAGISQTIKDYRAELIGGHSLIGHEVFAGLAASGQRLQRSDEVIPKPGDALILSKPIGTGILFASQMYGMIEGRFIDKMLDQLLISHYKMLELYQSGLISQMTDISGFGFAIHAYKLMKKLPFDLCATIELRKVPAFSGVEKMISKGVRSSLFSANYEYIEQQDDVVLPQNLCPGESLYQARELLFDPQTAGGILCIVDRENSERVLESLKQYNLDAACIVGSVEVKKGTSLHIQ